MKISILIIAHNEEAHIAECIEAIIHQTLRADKIILIAHNCSDTTTKIVETFPEVTLYEYNTKETGPAHAREY
jgi:glycosyltransferase involved in cell wall biosynthesis